MGFGISHYAFAAQPQPGQVELAIAKGCHLYDLGKLNEAMMEFQIALAQDPENQTAENYINKIWSRFKDTGISSWDLSEEITGYRNSLNARKKIQITDHQKPTLAYQGKPYERFINQTSFGYNDRHFEASSDKSFHPDGFFIAQHVRMDEPINNWQNTISLDARYHDNSHEDARLRRFMYSISEPGGLRFIAGDTSTNLSRYTMRGLYYRGVNLSVNNDINEIKVLWGATPHFLTKTQDHPNRDNGYIYPRKIFGIRDKFRVNDSYTVGVSFMDLKDSARVRTIDTSYNPKENKIVAIDQSIDAVPDIWRIETENAYSRSDEDRTEKAILIKEEKLRDFAHYIRSAIEIPKFRLINSYERLGPDFRSYSDLASTNVTWLSGLTSDREILDNYLEYRPFDFDPLYLDLRFSRIRNNLDDDNDVEMNQQTNYGAALRFIPEEYEWLPRASLRLKFLDTLSVPGSQSASNDVTDRDIIFELSKRLYGIDLNTSYTNRKTLDNIETFGTYTDIYNIRAAKELTDMVLLSCGWSHSSTYKDQNDTRETTVREDLFDINTALRLWAGANLSLGYSYENGSDTTGTLGNTDINTYSSTFSWPFSKYFLNSGRELVLAPYFTYQLSDGQTTENKNRYIWTAAVDATYNLAKDHKVSLAALYRQDENHYYDPATDSASSGIEDRRLLLTYQKIFQ